LGKDDYIAAWDISSGAVMIGDSSGIDGLSVYDNDPITANCASKNVRDVKDCKK